MLEGEKQQIVEQYALHERDADSVEVQIATLTKRINDLTDYLKIHKRGHHLRRGLLKVAGQRRSMLKYLTKTDIVRCCAIIEELGIRK